MRPPEGVGDDARPEPADEDVLLTQLDGAVPRVAEDLVRDVPLLDATGVAPHDGVDVLAEDLAKLLVGEVALLEPGRVLAVPQQRVAADDLLVPLREGDDRVCRAEVVDVALRVDEVPLELVLGRQRVELRREQAPVLRVGRERVGVVLRQVVATAGDGRPDGEVLGRQPSEGVLLREAGRARVVGSRRAVAGTREGGLRGGDGGGDEQHRCRDARKTHGGRPFGGHKPDSKTETFGKHTRVVGLSWNGRCLTPGGQPLRTVTATGACSSPRRTVGVVVAPKVSSGAVGQSSKRRALG